MKAIILGGGFAGCTVAHLLRRAGCEVMLFEREPHLGGGCRTFFHAGHPFTWGPRLYYGYSAKVFEWVNAITPLRRFPFELKTLAHEPRGEDRRFWTYPIHELDLERYPRADDIGFELSELKRAPPPAPENFEEYWLSRVGPTLYDMFVDHYSRRMWMIEDNRALDSFHWSAKDRPIEGGTREAYKGSYLAYPVAREGYNSYFERMTRGVEVLTNTPVEAVDLTTGAVSAGGRPFFGDVVVSTIPVDELCGHALGELPYAGRDFHLLVLPCRQVFPGDVRFCHYAGREDEWTRVTEFKKITYHESEDTLLVLEKPSKNGKLYPYVTRANAALAKRYLDALPPYVHSIGRLGRYIYSTIEQTITQAFECASRITGKPNPMDGQFFAIGDQSMLQKDRKASAL